VMIPFLFPERQERARFMIQLMLEHDPAADRPFVASSGVLDAFKNIQPLPRSRHIQAAFEVWLRKVSLQQSVTAVICPHAWYEGGINLRSHYTDRALPDAVQAMPAEAKGV